jgi:AcrR family transcriptional regulator
LRAETGAAPGLRERKKAETQRSLRDAALGLFQAKGFGPTSVDEIAAAANVSRSTFFRYFGSKESVLFAEGDEAGAKFLRLLEARPADEGPVVAFEEALVELAVQTEPAPERNSSRVLDRLLRQDPALQMRRVAETERWTAIISEIFAKRAGRSDPDSSDRLAAALLMATVEEIGHSWREQGPEIVEAVRSTFTTLRAVTTSP